MKEKTLQINQMNHLNLNDLTSDLDSKLSETLVIMDCENNEKTLQKKKIRKSISLNLEVQPPTPSSKSLNSNENPKGILKKANNVVHETGRDYFKKIQEQNVDVEPRPHNLEELAEADGLTPATIQSTFNLDDLGENDEIFLMEIPKSVNPELLAGQVLSLTEKSKLKIGENRYIATHREAKGNLSCVISTGEDSQSYKTVNIKPAGIIQVRQKLNSIPKAKPEYFEQSKIPLPQNIRNRDPFYGVVTTVTNIKVKKEFRKNR